MKKQLFDLVAASVGVVLLAPLLLLVALWIKLDSPGPVLFRQQRVGRRGVPFTILKFRTMADGPASGPQLTAHGDARITRAGRFLRRTKIDELPQLFNVLGGTMSLVGPRPEVPRYVACYPAAARVLVLSVVPGITDWSAIHFRDESALLARSPDPERTYIETILPVKLAYYQRYVRERSMRGDLHILLRTVSALLQRS